jgi:hypothetical protein
MNRNARKNDDCTALVDDRLLGYDAVWTQVGTNVAKEHTASICRPEHPEDRHPYFHFREDLIFRITQYYLQCDCLCNGRFVPETDEHEAQFDTKFAKYTLGKDVYFIIFLLSQETEYSLDRDRRFPLIVLPPPAACIGLPCGT